MLLGSDATCFFVPSGGQRVFLALFVPCVSHPSAGGLLAESLKKCLNTPLKHPGGESGCGILIWFGLHLAFLMEELPRVRPAKIIFSPRPPEDTLL